MEHSLRKKIRGNENIASELDIAGKSKTSEEDSSQYLTYDVLRIIFKYLNGMDLSSASMVCRSWLEAANNEKRTRGPVVFLIENYDKLQDGDVKEKIKKLNIKSAIGLFFRAPDLYTVKQDCQCTVLPKNCELISLGTYGAIINNKEIEDKFRQMVCAFLPEIPNTIIKMYTFGNNYLRPHDQMEAIKEIESVLGPPGHNTDRSKCLLIFSSIGGRHRAIKIANSLKQRYQNDALAVWGGVSNDLIVCNSKVGKGHRRNELVSGIWIVLSGAIQTWSIVIDEKCFTKDEIESQLKSLRSHVSLKKHSLGLMFVCCARGANLFGETDVESSIFKKVFPEVPLVGCFGDGEFGDNTIPTESSKKKSKWYNETSTVILILTYG